MRSLVHALRMQQHTGHPLPDRFASLAAAGVKLRRGELHLFVAPPGGGKSLVALDWAVNTDITGLYFSADSNVSTVIERIGAMRFGMTTDEIAMMLRSDGQQITDDLATLTRLKFVFDSNPTLDDIDEELKAWNEIYNKPPDSIWIDNLLDVAGALNEGDAILEITQELKNLARQSGSAVIALHHAAESKLKTGSTFPPPLRAVRNLPNQYPALILTFGLDAINGVLRVASAKNRSGPADPGAEKPLTLYVDLERMKLTETPPSTGVSDFWKEVT